MLDPLLRIRSSPPTPWDWLRGSLAGRIHRVDLVVLTAYLLLGVWVISGLWKDPQGRVITTAGDQPQFEWFLAHGAHAVTHLENPFLTSLLNTPLGVNLIANASVVGLAVLLAPVTLIFGAGAALAVALSGGLAGTAAAWYWLFSRHVVDSAAAAAVGGALCGFAPFMVSHAAASHLNFVCMFLLPVIVWRVVRLREGGRADRNGLILGLLIAYQALIGEEALLFTALGLGVFTLSYAIMRWSEVRTYLRTFLTGLAVAAGVAVVLLIYPLSTQFLGPQHYDGLPFLQGIGNDLMSMVAAPTRSLAGLVSDGPRFAYNLGEENSHFGWALLILGFFAGVALWRTSALVRAVTVTMVFFLIASLGPEIVVLGQHTGQSGLWRLFLDSPLTLLESVLPSRLAFVAVPCLGFLLAVATDRVLVAEPSPWVRRLWAGALAAALVPLLPTPLLTADRLPVPAFFTQGLWRQYVDRGGAVVSAKPARTSYTDPMRWQTATGMGFPIPHGYAISPSESGYGWYEPVARPTTRLLFEVADSGKPHEASPADQDTLRRDLRFWNGDVIVVDPRQPSADALRQTVEGLVGRPGESVGGMWVWDVRSLVS